MKGEKVMIPIAGRGMKLVVAQKNHCEIPCVNCGQCKYWGYNNGKPMNSVGDSKCLLRKTTTWKFSFCKHFEKIA